VWNVVLIFAIKNVVEILNYVVGFVSDNFGGVILCFVIGLFVGACFEYWFERPTIDV
jgi:uncharacterized membrane protein YraQ (UPF0718 family)